MIAEEALRFLAHEARCCRDRDSHWALCLLFPAVLKLMRLQPMDDVEAFSFKLRLRDELRMQEDPAPVHHYERPA